MRKWNWMWVVLGGVLAQGAGKVHTFSPPPTMTMGKFSPDDSVEVGKETMAKLKGKAKAPTDLDPESQVTLTWSWNVDRVELKGEHASGFETAPVGTYEVAVSGGGGSDSNAVLTLKPKRVGEWKVTVHGTATFTDKDGETWVGHTEAHEGVVRAKGK